MVGFKIPYKTRVPYKPFSSPSETTLSIFPRRPTLFPGFRRGRSGFRDGVGSGVDGGNGPLRDPPPTLSPCGVGTWWTPTGTRVVPNPLFGVGRQSDETLFGDRTAGMTQDPTRTPTTDPRPFYHRVSRTLDVRTRLADHLGSRTRPTGPDRCIGETWSHRNRYLVFDRGVGRQRPPNYVSFGDRKPSTGSLQSRTKLRLLALPTPCRPDSLVYPVRVLPGPTRGLVLTGKGGTSNVTANGSRSRSSRCLRGTGGGTGT